MSQESLPPLYEQIRRKILSQIDAGFYPPGTFLPPEADLCASYGVSRVTLRRAVGDLCDEGRLLRQQGRGTLVAPRKIQQQISLSGFSDAIEGMGRTATHEILRRDDDPEPIPALARLGASRPIRFDRLLSVDQRPMVQEALWFDAARFELVIPRLEAGGSFFSALREIYALGPEGAERIIDVGFASGPEAALLGISAAQPVYRIEKLVTGAQGVPIALSQVVTPCQLVTLRLHT